MNILDRIARDAYEERQGRIQTFPGNWVYHPTKAEINRTKQRNPYTFREKVHDDGRKMYLINQRAVLCPHPPDDGDYPTNDKRSSLHWLPYYKCRKCQYHQKGRRRGRPRFPCCKFEASENPAKDALADVGKVLGEAKKHADEIMGR